MKNYIVGLFLAFIPFVFIVVMNYLNSIDIEKYKSICGKDYLISHFQKNNITYVICDNTETFSIKEVK